MEEGLAPVMDSDKTQYDDKIFSFFCRFFSGRGGFRAATGNTDRADPIQCARADAQSAQCCFTTKDGGARRDLHHIGATYS